MIILEGILAVVWCKECIFFREYLLNDHFLEKNHNIDKHNGGLQEFMVVY